MTPPARCSTPGPENSPALSEAVGTGELSRDTGMGPASGQSGERERFLRALMASRTELEPCLPCGEPGAGPDGEREVGGRSMEAEVAIREDERRRIAADLHDGLCPELISISAMAKAVERLLETEGHALAQQLSAISDALSKASGHARVLVHGLDPVRELGAGLIPALQELVATTSTTHRIRCDLECRSTVSVPDSNGSRQLYRIAQEAIHNAVRHSGARWIELEIAETGSEIRLAIADDGCGVPAEAGNGYGMRAMQYRADQIGGSLTIQNREGGGTEVVCRWPKPAEPSGLAEPCI